MRLSISSSSSLFPNFPLALALILAVILTGYLVYALIKPEKL